MRLGQAIRTLRLSERVNRQPQRAGGGDHAVVVACQGNVLSLFVEKIDRRQMENVESSDGNRKRLQGAGQYGRGEFDQGDPPQQRAHFVGVRTAEFARVDTRPDLVFKEPTGEQVLVPKTFRRRAIFGEEMR